MQWRVRGFATSVLVAVVTVGGLAAAQPAETPPTTAATAPMPTVPLPESDAFYRQPGDLGDADPGTVLRSRAVSVTGLGIPLPVDAWQVMYASRDAKGEPVADVATVIVPATPYAGGDRPLLSYQTAEDSLALRCAPSYTLRTGTEKELGLIAPALTAGWAVVVPDYEGPESQYGAGWQAGRAVLDSIRAATRFGPAGLDASTPVGMWGYSGGGLATAWASELKPTYAPEIELVGVSQGGVPPDLGAVARQIDGTAFSGIYFAAAVGLSRAYPEMRIDDILNERGKQMLRDIGDMCITELSASYAFQKLSDYTTVDHPLQLQRIRAVIAENRLGQRLPDGPVYGYHAIADELIPIDEVDDLMASYCAHGVATTYYRDPVNEHISLAVTGATAAMAYLQARFAGIEARGTC